MPRPTLVPTVLALLLAGTGAFLLGRVSAPGPGAPPDPTARIEAFLEATLDAGWPHLDPGLPEVLWIPGEDAWLRWRTVSTAGPPADRVLERVDAATGAVSLVATEPALADAAGPEHELGAAAGIGRRGPPEVVFAPDGRGIVVRRRGALLHVDPEGRRAPVRLTRGGTISDVRVAPGGRRVSFVRDHDVRAVLVEGTDDAPTVRELALSSDGSETLRRGALDWLYPEELEATTASWWSPDGARHARLDLDATRVPRFPIVDPTPRHGALRQQAYPYAGDPNPVPSIRIRGVEAGTEVEADLGALAAAGEVYAPWALFTPDGADLLVAVLDRPQRSFELLRVDPATGRSKPLWRESDAAWVDLPAPPRPLPSRDAVLLRSRRDGWWRPWLVPLDGGTPRPLTAGPEDAGPVVGVDEARGLVFLSVRTADGLRDVLRAIPLDGGSPATLLDDGASHTVSFSSTGRFFVDTASRATSPPRAVLRRADGTEVRVLSDTASPRFPTLALRPPAFLSLPAADGTPLRAMLFLPSEPPPDGCPVVVSTYGGPGSRSVADAWQGGHFLARALVHLGCAVLVVDGRGTGGRGKAFEAVVVGRLGDLEADDQAAAVRALRGRPGIRAGRAGITGGSYGGFLALAAIRRHPEVFRAAAALAPVTDWRLYDSAYTERYMGTPASNDAGYRATSLVEGAAGFRGDLLVLHGLSDDNVHAQNTFRLQDAWLAAGVPFDLEIYPRRGHGIEGDGARRDTIRRVLRHFVGALRPGGAGGR